jgi:enoyl-CoA hydratase/carnithine racemase
MPHASEQGGTVTSHISGGVARVTIDNPGERNAMTSSMCRSLIAVTQELDTDDAVDMVILHGGRGTFCSGASIGELPDILGLTDATAHRGDLFSLVDAAIGSLVKPIVALVEGACMGGGWQLASACDFIVASDDALFGITPAKLGILYPRAGLERLIRTVGPETTKYLLMTGCTIGAHQAQTLGLVTHVLPHSGFQEEALSIVSDMARRSQFSNITLKSLVDATATRPADLDALWARAWQDTAAGPDMAIGISSFQHKTAPQFKWRVDYDSPKHD